MTGRAENDMIQLVKELFDTCEINMNLEEHIVNIFRLGKKKEGKARQDKTYFSTT